MPRLEMRLTKLLVLLLMELSLSACSTVPRPDTNIGVVNNELHKIGGYNLLKDYDDNGNLNPNATPWTRPVNSAADLDKNICTDPDGWANLKAYIRMLREQVARQLEDKK